MDVKYDNPLLEVVITLYKNAREFSWERVIDLVIHGPKYYEIWWSNLFREAPLHVVIETTLVLFIIWLLFIRKTVDPKKSSKADNLSRKEVQWLLDTWEPEPLVPDLDYKHQQIAQSMVTIEEINGQYMSIEGVTKPVLNVASNDFLRLSNSPEVIKASIDALDFYGCGSCGPRGFYGTIDQHLLLEQAIAQFMGTEEAISYSDSSSAISSAIPAFSKKGDLLIVDEACSEPILTGVNLSRSTVQFFKHNDLADLREILEGIARDDKKFRRDTTQQRRFIVVEGVYRSTGEICPLPEIVALKDEFLYRIVLDESLSFGTMGATGRGLVEHFQLKPSDVEVLLVPLDTTLASVGGVCVGSREIVEHQRLSGAGYCFSASACPFLSAAAITSLQILEQTPSLIADLQSNTELLNKLLKKVTGMKIVSDKESPSVHLVLSKQLESQEAEAHKIMQIARICLERGIGLSCSKFNLKQKNMDIIRPCIVVNSSVDLTEKQIGSIVTALNAAIRATK